MTTLDYGDLLHSLFTWLSPSSCTVEWNASFDRQIKPEFVVQGTFKKKSMIPRRQVFTALLVVVTVCAFSAEGRLRGTERVEGVEARLPQRAPSFVALDSRRDFDRRRVSSPSNFPHYNEYLLATAECDDEFRKYSLGWAKCIQVKFYAISSRKVDSRRPIKKAFREESDDDVGLGYTSRYTYTRNMGLF